MRMMMTNSNPVALVSNDDLSALKCTLSEKYSELVIKGQLSAYFTLVDGGYLDAAQLLTDQVRASIESFLGKIEEAFKGLLAESACSEAGEALQPGTSE
jgi:hypothetical protein